MFNINVAYFFHAILFTSPENGFQMSGIAVVMQINNRIWIKMSTGMGGSELVNDLYIIIGHQALKRRWLSKWTMTDKPLTAKQMVDLGQAQGGGK